MQKPGCVIGGPPILCSQKTNKMANHWQKDKSYYYIFLVMLSHWQSSRRRFLHVCGYRPAMKVEIYWNPLISWLMLEQMCGNMVIFQNFFSIFLEILFEKNWNTWQNIIIIIIIILKNNPKKKKKKRGKQTLLPSTGKNKICVSSRQ